MSEPIKPCRWFWTRPLLLVLLAHTIFSIGIWNAREGYGEDSFSADHAFRVLQTHHPDHSIYVDIIALVIKSITPDPVSALTLMKYLASLLATVALYLTLNCFASYLRPSAILIAVFVWIASWFDAPFLQSTSLALFSYAVMLFGFYCLLRGESVAGFVGFYFFGLLAMFMHPEYSLPVFLISIWLAGRTLWRWANHVRSSNGLPRFLTFGAAVLVLFAAGTALLAYAPKPIANQLAHADRYALRGLGQCYADFYHRTHPSESFSSMTEYQALLDRTFGHPKGFVDAVKYNPMEAARYFVNNAAHNLSYVPQNLLGHYREHSEGHRSRLTWITLAILLAGGIFGVIRFCRAGYFLAMPRCAVRQLFLLGVLLITSAPAILLILPLSRYLLPWIPLYYLGVAFCVDSLLKALRLVPFERWIVLLAGVCFCWPNYLSPRPNYELDAIRRIAPEVIEHPRIAAWWAQPDTILGFRGQAEPVNIWDGIRQDDLVQGRLDIILIDENFRSTRTWAAQREFFENFERHPGKVGFKKLTGCSTGRFDIYYRPKSALPNPK